MKQLTICGMGLIGGSLALAARRNGLAGKLVGVDLEATIARAPAEPVVDEWVPFEDAVGRSKAFGSADLCVLAMPVGVIRDVLPEALEGGAVVTDCGSTKRAIAQLARARRDGDRFVPGHPMAGHPEGGLANARADLFEGRHWILSRSAAKPFAVELVEKLVRGVGADVVFLEPEEHDRSVALTSHVPQLVASTLAVLAEETSADRAAGPGFASATRVAGGAASMWNDIFESNGDAVAQALRLLGERLGRVADALEKEPVDPGAALEILAEARRIRGRD